MKRWLFTWTDPMARFASVRVISPSKERARDLIEDQLKVSADYFATGPGRVIAAYMGNAANCEEPLIESAMMREAAPV